MRDGGPKRFASAAPPSRPTHRSRAHAACDRHTAPSTHRHTAPFNASPPCFITTPLTPRSVCIVSILRLHSLVAISNSTDQSYDNPSAATWSSIEVNVGIICSCLPLLRPLMHKFLPGVFSSHRRNTPSTAPRAYPTIGSARSRPLPSTHAPDFALQTSTMKGTCTGSRGSSDAEGTDIQVRTQITVLVEGPGEADGYGDGWSTPRSGKTVGGRSSVDTLVKDGKDVV